MPEPWHTLVPAIISAVASLLVGFVGGSFVADRQHRQRVAEEKLKWEHDAESARVADQRMELDKCTSCLGTLTESAALILQAAEYAQRGRLDDSLEVAHRAHTAASHATFDLAVAGHEDCKVWWSDVEEAFDNVRAIAEDSIESRGQFDSNVEFTYLKAVITDLRQNAIDLSQALNRKRREMT